MITLRSYTNPIDASMAQSLLESRGIACELADENANEYGGAPFAMPIRLLVADEQLDEAREILREAGPGDGAISDDELPGGMAELRKELTKIRNGVQTNTALMVLLLFALGVSVLILVGSSRSATNAHQADSWNAVRSAMERSDYDTAMAIAQRLRDAHPNSYYAYSFLGYIALEQERLDEAQSYFQREYELLPTEEHRQLVEAVQKKIAERKK